MTESIQLDTHYDCTASHRITELEGPDHLASLMPGTIILVNGWEYMKLHRRQGWASVSGTRLTGDQFWMLLGFQKRAGRKVSLLHVGAA